MILSELLTGRRPTGTPPPELRAGDPRSDELESFLHRCLAPRESRFASAVYAHREIQQMVTGNPFSLYTANLALFLYKLLNPESQLAAPTSDWESTNPVVLDPSATVASRRDAAVVFASPPPHRPSRSGGRPRNPKVEAAIQAVAAAGANAILKVIRPTSRWRARSHRFIPWNSFRRGIARSWCVRFDQDRLHSQRSLSRSRRLGRRLADVAPDVILRKVTAGPAAPVGERLDSSRERAPPRRRD